MRRALLAAAVAVAAALAAPVQASPPPVVVDAAAWYLEGQDGEFLAGSNERQPRPIASITKLMTAIVVLERARLSDVVRVRSRAARVGESTVHLRAGEELTVAALLRAMLVPSANDAAEALALHVGKGSTDRFVALMNAKGDELGLVDTHFENPHGLDARGHVSSARDATVLVRYALGVPFIRDALDRSTVVLPGGKDFPTTDDLLVNWPALVGGKTGHTREAGWSQAAGARAGGATVYGAVLGSDTRSSRNGALRELLTYGLEQYLRIAAIDAGRGYAEPETGYGKGPVALVAPRTIVRTLRVGTPLVERVVAPSSVALPVRKGQRLGRVEVYDGNRLVASSDLVAGRSVAEPGLLGKARWYATRTAANLWGLVT
ncbi:MAG TPA: D-alanyl-D-alanine carboxypeptidase family protein [Gaiellaceae bacterium]|jgi:D-alanyl-D-alanine carboxypeptidase (penicillin-binding protein 5/6)|nr:D-alanyl-D-alanine carboxypeptidase family protein [Gaiellaceae bacterium]